MLDRVVRLSIFAAVFGGVYALAVLTWNYFWSDPLRENLHHPDFVSVVLPSVFLLSIGLLWTVLYRCRFRRRLAITIASLVTVVFLLALNEGLPLGLNHYQAAILAIISGMLSLIMVSGSVAKQDERPSKRFFQGFQIQ